jgi:hypothetical protein
MTDYDFRVTCTLLNQAQTTNMEYCRAITKKELLCKRKACKNSVYCTQHKPEYSCSKFNYSISNELVTDYTKILPDDIIRNIYKMYFTSNVLEELKKYENRLEKLFDEKVDGLIFYHY